MSSDGLDHLPFSQVIVRAVGSFWSVDLISEYRHPRVRCSCPNFPSAIPRFSYFSLIEKSELILPFCFSPCTSHSMTAALAGPRARDGRGQGPIAGVLGTLGYGLDPLGKEEVVKL